MKQFLVVLSLMGLAFTPSASAYVAVLGDSISTGAVAHPDIGFDGQKLNAIVSGTRILKPNPSQIKQIQSTPFGVAADFEAPTRLFMTRREYLGGLQWFGKHLLIAVSHLYLDVEQYTWANFIARKLGTPPQDILIAAEDGARIASATRQLDRVLDHTKGILPRHLFVLFTGNDLCGPFMNYVTEAEDYGDALERLVDYAVRNGRVPSSGTDVWVLDPIGALQLTFSPSIQEKVVSAHGKKMTCKELHRLDPTERLGQEGVMQLIPPTPTAYCPMLLTNKSPEDRERLGIIGNRIIGYREELAKRLRDYNQSSDAAVGDGALRLHHIRGSGKIVLDAIDIAEDCFHLSLAGQLKLAQTVFDEMP